MKAVEELRGLEKSGYIFMDLPDLADEDGVIRLSLEEMALELKVPKNTLIRHVDSLRTMGRMKKIGTKAFMYAPSKISAGDDRTRARLTEYWYSVKDPKFKKATKNVELKDGEARIILVGEEE